MQFYVIGTTLVIYMLVGAFLWAMKPKVFFTNEETPRPKTWSLQNTSTTSPLAPVVVLPVLGALVYITVFVGISYLFPRKVIDIEKVVQMMK